MQTLPPHLARVHPGGLLRLDPVGDALDGESMLLRFCLHRPL
mgnify:FL=1